MTDTLKTVQALVEALEDITNCGAEAWGEHRNCNKQARAALTEGRALIAQMQRDAVQPGWKLVPMEPTDAMTKAAYALHAKPESNSANAPTLRDYYRAMLAAAPHPEAQALDSARPVTEQEDRVLRNAALRSSTLVAKGKLVDSQLQQPDGHSTRASGVCATTAHAVVEAIARQWDECMTEMVGIGEIDIGATIRSDGVPKSLVVASTGADTARHGQDDNAGSPAPSDIKRYRWDQDDEDSASGFMVGPVPDGEWVRYADITHSAESSKAALSDEEIHRIWMETPERPTLAEEVLAFGHTLLARAGITPQAGKESGE